MSLLTRLRPPSPADTPATDADKAPRTWRLVLGRIVTVLAAVLIFAALLLPNQPFSITPTAFLRVPVEALVAVALLLVLPGRARSIVALTLGALLGLLTLIKALDLGFWSFLNRQFDLVADWGLLDDGLGVLEDSIGKGGARAVAALVLVLAVAVVSLLALATLRLSRVIVRHRRVSTRAGIAVTAAWVVCATLGAQVVPGLPVASRSEAEFVRDRALLVRQGVENQRAFERAVEVDSFAKTPANQLLTGLAGKDVVVSFIESYGRSAIEDPALSAYVNPVLDEGTKQLTAAGFTTRSAWLTSPTYGGYSWLAHSTFQSGLSIDNQMRYLSLVSSDRFTLTGAFKRAGWDTVGIEPDNTYAWPEGDFYGYRRIWDARNLGYQGPHFSWSRMPDQYTLAAFQRNEYGRKGRGPMLAEVTLTSSHTPWAPIPQMIDWDAVGNGSVYTAQAAAGKSPDQVWKDPAQVRTEYAKSVAYSVSALTSWAQKYGDDNLVLVFLGDHQAAPIVSGEHASHDVPITIVAKDPKVLDRISGWGWQDGLKPGPQAPVWPMDAFRDRFLTTFGPQGESH
ncbi:sulfatase-like hydrolase/transferase [Krasilnikovia sp. MM14-A1259]|uniref:sulfatase-like hydrolase/transferase n=1 Tax=Krasilnikovia sp. MM14-A1259 TaxID=3373539 RepID=UPI00399CC542